MQRLRLSQKGQKRLSSGGKFLFPHSISLPPSQTKIWIESKTNALTSGCQVQAAKPEGNQIIGSAEDTLARNISQFHIDYHHRIQRRESVKAPRFRQLTCKTKETNFNRGDPSSKLEALATTQYISIRSNAGSR